MVSTEGSLQNVVECETATGAWSYRTLAIRSANEILLLALKGTTV